MSDLAVMIGSKGQLSGFSLDCQKTSSRKLALMLQFRELEQNFFKSILDTELS